MKRDKTDILTNIRTSKLLSHDFFFAMFMAQKNSALTTGTLTRTSTSTLSIKKACFATCDRSTSADSQDDWKLKRKFLLAVSNNDYNKPIKVSLLFKNILFSVPRSISNINNLLIGAF